MNKANYSLESGIIMLFAFIAVFYGTSFETEYSNKLINLYINPWWRVLIVALVVAAAMWSPRIGILVALVAFFYLSDVGTLITPFVATQEENK
jgi:hypothetical protein